MKAVALLLGILATATANAADCGPDTLGTARTITLKRESALYGANQHAPLPLQKGEVVLTFDDGPIPETTPLVLKALADQCAKATFFMIGENLAKAPELGRRVAGEGHSTGIHSNTHPHLATLGAAEQLADLKQAQASYQAAFGSAAPAYRFPFLEETPTMLAALKEASITVASIDLGINDWLPDDTNEILAARLVKSLDASNGGGIILMHDANPPTAKAIPTLLKVLKSKGYRVVHVEWEK
ncbi:polysaccharide deacetylase family protein [Duganella hordei]|uniref:polysaccharide deacetylase family protein n=1 Tax=Duganella hordei TaxID=2865934 RepID=UPI0030E9BDC5